MAGWRGGGAAGAVWAQEKYELKTSMGEVVGRLGTVLASQKKYGIYAAASILLSSAFQMVPPVATKYVIDTLIPRADTRTIIALAIGLIMLYLARFGMLYVARWSTAVAAQALVYDLAQRMFENIQRLSLRFYERNGTGDIISRVSSDISVIQQAVTGGTVNGVVGLVNITAFGIIMVVLD